MRWAMFLFKQMGHVLLSLFPWTASSRFSALFLGHTLDSVLCCCLPSGTPDLCADTGVIRQLGEFYKRQGVRSRLPRSVGEELLAKLSAAQDSLPLPPSADGKQKA